MVDAERPTVRILRSNLQDIISGRDRLGADEKVRSLLLGLMEVVERLEVEVEELKKGSSDGVNAGSY